MKKIISYLPFVILQLTLLFSINTSFSQETFLKIFTPKNYYIPFGNSNDHLMQLFMVKLNDNSFLGCTQDDGSNGDYSFYKINDKGQIIWRKKFNYLHMPSKAILLSDSNIAILYNSFNQPQFGGIMKITPNGDILWVKEYSLIYPYFISCLIPTSNGGMLINGTGCPGPNIFLKLDSNGNILSMIKQSSILLQKNAAIFDFVKENNTYKCFGIYSVINENNKMAFFDIDSSGYFSNYKIINLQGLGTIQPLANNSGVMTKTTDSNFYCVSYLNSYQLVLLYMNSQNQNIWAKSITLPYKNCYPLKIVSTNDNSCLIFTGQYQDSIPGYNFRASVMKFSSNGLLQWSKFIGNSTTLNDNRFSISDVFPSNNTFIVSGISKFDCFFGKVDSTLNGFCDINQFQPVITNLTTYLNSDNFEDFITQLPFISTNFNTYSFPSDVFVFDACNLTLVDSLIVDVPNYLNFEKIKIYPNPVQNTLKITNIFTNSNISIYDFNGKLMLTEKAINSFSFDISNFSKGIYIVKVQNKDEVIIRKFIKE